MHLAVVAVQIAPRPDGLRPQVKRPPCRCHREDSSLTLPTDGQRNLPVHLCASRQLARATGTRGGFLERRLIGPLAQLGVVHGMISQPIPF